MSVNLVPEDALPKSFYLEAEVRPDRDLHGCEPDRPGDAKHHVASPVVSIQTLSADETLKPDHS